MVRKLVFCVKSPFECVFNDVYSHYIKVEGVFLFVYRLRGSTCVLLTNICTIMTLIDLIYSKMCLV